MMKGKYGDGSGGIRGGGIMREKYGDGSGECSGGYDEEEMRGRSDI
jgi:hypothetical protein